MKAICIAVIASVALLASAVQLSRAETAAAPLTSAVAPRVVVWDPQQATAGSRFTVDPAAFTSVANEMQSGGVQVTRLTAAQFADKQTFSAQQFDAIVLLGGILPRIDLAPLQSFAGDGGVVIDLDADVPFLICLEQGSDGTWQLSPTTPRFAWQTSDLLKQFGLRDDFQQTALEGQGVLHTSTPLFKKYLPQAIDLHGRLPGKWIVPGPANKDEHGDIYPLIRSQRLDNADVPPQLYVARHGASTAIISTSDLYTADVSKQAWPFPAQTAVAIAHLAKDLHDKTVELTPAMAVDIREKMTPELPGTLDRVAYAEVDPEQATPIVRWGRFDGSCEELGPGLNAGQSADVAVDAPASDTPRSLAPGAAVRLHLPPLASNQQMYLRIRGAYKATGATLKAVLGDREVMDESFTYIDTSGKSNWNHNLVGVPFEFSRTAFIAPPSKPADVLTISNPGKSPITFDAIQVETRSQLAPAMWIGLGAGNENHIPPELSHQWSAMRMSIRTNWLGEPGDPNRFDKMDAQFNQVAALNPHVQPILEGTPAWAAISPERLAEAVTAKRDRTVIPDTRKYEGIVQDIIKRYGDRIQTYEIWNEADISQFWRGTPEEYASFFKSIEPIIRRLAPQAKVMLTGMSGFRPDFLKSMLDLGVIDRVDLFGFHPYSGKSAGWDAPYGLLQGWFYSHGVNKEVYCNESGFPYQNAEWFTAPPTIDPQWQADRLNTAIARLLADGLSKLNVFNAGGDDNAYGLFDANGKPRPAYNVIADYVALGQPDARRLDISLTATDGAPLEGVYAAAASYPNDKFVVVVNPIGVPPTTSLETTSTTVAEKAAVPVHVHLRFPVESQEPLKVTFSTGGDATVRPEGSAGVFWAELDCVASTRMVIRCGP